MSPTPALRLVASRPQAAVPPALQGLSIFERGWLSCNNVLIHGRSEDEGATLVDSSHCLHADQTVALLRAALGDEPLRCVLNTHLHSDHCGGNTAVKQAFGVPVFIPSGTWEAVHHWDDDRLSFTATSQRIVPFTAEGTLCPDQPLSLGGRHWDVVAAPGHDPDAVMLFDTDQGVLISGDALWQDGFGVVFPELEGERAFGDVGAVLDLIETLPVQWVIPGHGAPFNDVGKALAKARSRLAAFEANPSRHARYAAKVLLKYHLMEERQQGLAALHLWAGSAPLVRLIWQNLGCPQASVHAWCDELIADMVRSGAVAVRDGVVHNA